MATIRRSPRAWTSRALLLSGVLLILAAVAAHAHLKVSKTEPASGAVVSQPVPSIHVWLTQEPDVALSKLELIGPGGPVALEPVASTGKKDLVAKVSGAMADGQYTAKWQTAGDDGHVQKGEWTFTVKRAG
jgi:methionine-rich copper-binding protein CopC